MEPVALFNHGINLLAPAFWIALLLPMLSRLFIRNKPVARIYIGQAAIHFIVCSVVLMIGLLIFGRDGKMLTYLGLVAASASTQWVLVKGWRG